MMLSACLLLTGMSVLPRLSANRTQISQTQNEIRVAVQGEVNAPGSYVLPWGASVEDALAAAGGLTPQADAKLINLAAPLDAGEAVFVAGVQAETGAERVSINSASAAVLQTLPRIGPAMAERIIQARPFNTVDDLLNVKGIGEKTLDKLRPLVTL